MPQFVIEHENIKDNQVLLSKNDQDFHHIFDVCRTQVGEKVNFITSENIQYKTELLEFDKKLAKFKVLEKSKYEKVNEFVLLQCIPKQKKMDLIIEKAVELGVNKIVPVVSKNVVAKSEKIEKWQNIATAAVKQSGNPFIPKIEKVVKFQDAVKNFYDKNALNLIAYEKDSDDLNSITTDCKKVNLIVGAEGGFDETEIDIAKKIGWKVFHIKGNILRVETASIALTSIIKFKLKFF